MKQKVALVLSGGGARGLAHIGVIEELEHRGFEITSLAGTSMGAVVGGIYALGKLKEYKKWMYSLDMTKVFHLIDFAFSTQGLIKGDRVFNKLREFIQDQKIETLPIPFVAVSTDLKHRKEVVFREGSIYDALRASVAIPTVVTPVKTEDALLVDGGVLNNIPIHLVERHPGDILVVSNVNANVPVEIVKEQEVTPAKLDYLQKITLFYNQLFDHHKLTKDEHMGYFDLMDETMGIMANRIAELEMEKHKPDILIQVSRDLCKTFDFYKAREIVKTGRSAAKIKLEEYKKRK